VAEPTGNYPFVGHKGLAWFEIETTGVTAHGSMPEVGDNAIVKMARVIDDLGSFRFPVENHHVMGRPTMNVGTIAGGLNTNSVPDRARITVDTRTVPGIDHVLREAVDDDPELVAALAELGRRAGIDYAYVGVVTARKRA
jgi:succinyl-diaminopimelate desuccinylase